MADVGTKYETRTVRTLRGTEPRTIAKWEKEGWEVVSQSHTRLQTELKIRRPKPATPWRLYAIGGGVAAVLLTVAIVTGIINEGGSSGRNEAAGNSRDDGTSAPSTAASNEPEPSASSAPAAIALTPESNAELAALLQLGNICDDSIAAFAEKYKGAMIAFDGSIGALNNHNGATTRYDLLLGAGDFSETSAPGPAFQYRDVNLTNDLHYVGVVPDTIGVGTNLRVTAEVDEYEPNTCLFLLEPVETSIR